MGVALRSRVPLALRLPSMVWKPLVGEGTGIADLAAVDGAAARAIRCFRGMGELGVNAANYDELFDQVERRVAMLPVGVLFFIYSFLPPPSFSFSFSLSIRVRMCVSVASLASAF
jgi:hypothetical protein